MAKYFPEYTPYNYCSRCKDHTRAVTRVHCDPGRHIRAACPIEEAKGPHLHCFCNECGNEWIMCCQPPAEHMVVCLDTEASESVA